MRNQSQSLKKLELGCIDLSQLSWLLRDLNLLNFLSVYFLSDDGEENFRQHNSIEVLQIKFFDYSQGGTDEEILNFQQIRQRLLLCLPEVKELTDFNEFSSEDIRFLGKFPILFKLINFRGRGTLR